METWLRKQILGILQFISVTEILEINEMLEKLDKINQKDDHLVVDWSGPTIFDNPETQRINLDVQSQFTNAKNRLKKSNIQEILRYIMMSQKALIEQNINYAIKKRIFYDSYPSMYVDGEYRKNVINLLSKCDMILKKKNYITHDTLISLMRELGNFFNSNIINNPNEIFKNITTDGLLKLLDVLTEHITYTFEHETLKQHHDLGIRFEDILPGMEYRKSLLRVLIKDSTTYDNDMYDIDILLINSILYVYFTVNGAIRNNNNKSRWHRHPELMDRYLEIYRNDVNKNNHKIKITPDDQIVE